MNNIKRSMLFACMVSLCAIPSFAVKSAPETISGNFLKSTSGFQKGAYGLALASSRLALESSEHFAKFGKFMAEHHWLFGATVASAAFLYWLSPFSYKKEWRSREVIDRRITKE